MRTRCNAGCKRAGAGRRLKVTDLMLHEAPHHLEGLAAEGPADVRTVARGRRRPSSLPSRRRTESGWYPQCLYD